MSNLEARVLTESEYMKWDQLIRQSKQGTVFHLSDWITTAAKNLHLDYVIIGVFKDSELIGGCFFYIKKMIHFFKIGYTAVPLTPYGGFVISIPESTNVRTSEGREHEIISLILEKINTLNLKSINLVNSPALLDVRPFIWQGWKGGVYYTYIMPLDNDIFSRISHNTRTNIRKAQKYGIKVKKEYDPDIYWKLTKLTYEKQNITLPFQKDYLVNLMEMVIKNNLGEMWIAETSVGEAVSSAFVLFDSHLVQGWIAANDPDFKHTGVVSLLLFEIFEDVRKRGYQHFNLMAANTPHLAFFYSSFNPQLVPYYNLMKSKSDGIFLRCIEWISHLSDP